MSITFYGIGLLHDCTTRNYVTSFTLFSIAIIICILKTLWTSSNVPYYAIDKPLKTPALIINTVIEVIVLLQVWYVLAAGINIAE